MIASIPTGESHDRQQKRQSSIEAERQLPILDNRSIEGYVNEIGERLAAVAPGANFPYQFKIVNASDINAFALPGGYPGNWHVYEAVQGYGVTRHRRIGEVRCSRQL